MSPILQEREFERFLAPLEMTKDSRYSFCWFRIMTYLDVTPSILFFLHCGDNYGAEALRGHWGLDKVGVPPAGFV